MAKVKHAIETYRAISDPRKWSRSKRASLRRAELHLGDVPLAELTRGHLIAWVMGGYPGSAGTAVHALKTLGAAFAWISDCDALPIPHPTAPRDAARALARRSIGTYRRRTPPRITDTDIHRIREHWRSATPSAFLWFLIDTPIRGAELCRITWQDYTADPAAPFITIRNMKDPHGTHGNHKAVPLLGRAAELLAASAQPKGRIFPHPRDTLASAFTSACARAGLPALTLHCLRHEGITRLAAAGFTDAEIMAVTGHKSAATLRIYTHLRPADIHRRSAELIPDRPSLFPSPEPKPERYLS